MSRFSAVLDELNSARAQLAALEHKQDEQAAQLRALPTKFGYKTLNEFIRALRQNAAETSRLSAPQVKPAEPARGMVRASLETEAVQPPTLLEPVANDVSAGTPAAKLPSGSSLDDPSNFGLMPDNSLLDPTLGDPIAHRIQLTKSLEFARNVLHTSRVPAAIWREWRNFERRGVEVLKGEMQTPAVA